MNAARLLEYFDKIAEAPDAISRLRKFILDLAIRGKLVEQDQNDEPASELLKKILRQRTKLEKEGTIARIKPWCPIDPSELPCGYSDITFFARLGYLFSLQKGLTGIQGAKPGKYPLIVTASHRASCDHYDFEGSAAIIPIVSSAGHGCASINRLHYQEGKFAVGSILCAAFSLDEDLLSARFVYEYLSAYKEELLVPKMVGTANVSLTIAKIAEVPIPLVSQRSQSRLYELMALCDRLEASQAKRESRRNRLVSASVKRIGQSEDVGNSEEFRDHVRFHLHHLPRLATRPEHVKELRQTILNLAVRGKLVPQDPNDEPASELLKKIHLEKVKLSSSRKLVKDGFEYDAIKQDGPFQLPTGWAWARFPELGIFGRGKSKHRPRNDAVLFDGGTHYFVQTGDVARSNGVIKTYTSKYNEIGLAQSAKWPAGTLCITIAANIADSGILSFDACFPDSVVGFVPAKIYDNARYFEYFMRTAKADLLEFAPATAQKNINLNILSSVLIPLPPIAEQHRIVAKVDELMNLCDQLETHLATNQTNQSRLLEATLCDALGVTCLPVSRLSRPAPSPTRVAATHSEQPFKPIAPRPVAVETPKVTVQGSLIEHPTPQVEKPRVANGDIPGAILGQMQPGQEYSRAQLAEALGLSVYEWNMAIRELKESGRVVQTGERRGARYQLKNGE